MGLGIDLAATKSTYGSDSRQWLGSAHGTQSTRSVTLDGDDASWAPFVTGQNGNVPAGTALVISATGLATRAAAPVGTATAAVPNGYLYSGVKVATGRRTGAAAIERGRIRTQYLPTGDTTGRSPLFTYMSV